MPVLATDASGNLTEPIGVAVPPSEALAAAGSVIANAAAIGANVGFVTVSGADDAKGVILPAGVRGKSVEVYNEHATAGLKVYPPVNSTINGGSANAAVAVEGKLLARFVATNSTNWSGAFTANA